MSVIAADFSSSGTRIDFDRNHIRATTDFAVLNNFLFIPFLRIDLQVIWFETAGTTESEFDRFTKIHLRECNDRRGVKKTESIAALRLAFQEDWLD
jgi:hypothetical protein